MKKILKVVLLSLLTLSLFACGTNSASGDAASGGAGSAKSGSAKSTTKKPKVEISVKDFGVMQAELEPDVAPITVKNFLKLVNDGFYNGLTFHRVIPDFMIQGGDPTGNGDGGTGETIKGEFKSNGVENDISHTRGVISMARWGDEPDSASSQFFIVHKDAVSLDGEYAAFGRVISGIEVVDKICDEVSTIDDLGIVDKVDQPVIEYIKEIK